MSARHAITALLATCGAVCGGVCGAARAEDAASLNPMAALGRDALNSVVELPLFDPLRHLPAAPPPAVVDLPPPVSKEPPPNLQLVGIVHHGRRDVAIVHRDGAEKTVILRNGEKLGVWTVRVHPLGVTLSEGGRAVDFAIFAKSGGARPPDPPQAMAVGQLRRPPDE